MFKSVQFAAKREIYFHEDDYCQQELLPRESLAYAEAEVKKVAEFAEGVGRVIEKAPPWSAEWETPAWTDDVIEGVEALPKPKVLQPTLD